MDGFMVSVMREIWMLCIVREIIIGTDMSGVSDGRFNLAGNSKSKLVSGSGCCDLFSAGRDIRFYVVSQVLGLT